MHRVLQQLQQCTQLAAVQAADDRQQHAVATCGLLVRACSEALQVAVCLGSQRTFRGGHAEYSSRFMGLCSVKVELV